MIYAMAELDFYGRESGYIKIGFVDADDPETATGKARKRLIDLQQGNPRQLAIIGMLRGNRKTEKELHTRFSAQRVKSPTSGEWARVEGPVVAWLDIVRIAEPIRFKRAADKHWARWLHAWKTIGARYVFECRCGSAKEELAAIALDAKQGRRCSRCNTNGHNVQTCTQPRVSDQSALPFTSPFTLPPRHSKAFVWRGKLRYGHALNK